MYTTLVLARSLGILFSLVGVSVLLNRKGAASAIARTVGDEGSLWFAGFAALSMGAVMVALNNVWTTGLPLFITVLGWLALIKGVAILAAPKCLVSFYSRVVRGGILIWSAVACILLGLALLYLSM